MNNHVKTDNLSATVRQVFIYFLVADYNYPVIYS